MKEQIWFCLSCRKCGVTLFELHEDAYTVATRVRREHLEETSRRPVGSCTEDPRVIPNSYITELTDHKM